MTETNSGKVLMGEQHGYASLAPAADDYHVGVVGDAVDERLSFPRRQWVSWLRAVPDCLDNGGVETCPATFRKHSVCRSVRTNCQHTRLSANARYLSFSELGFYFFALLQKFSFRRRAEFHWLSGTPVPWVGPVSLSPFNPYVWFSPGGSSGPPDRHAGYGTS